MLVSKRVSIKTSSANKFYWWGLGYAFADPSYNQRHKLPMPVIEVNTDHLQEKSNVKVECWCEKCEAFFTKRFSRYSQFCNKCNKVEQNKGLIGNTFGRAHKGKKHPNQSGELHPRWNPNKSEFKKYVAKVNSLTKQTYQLNELTINPNNYPRTLCGVNGGYQLDHIVSLKHGFDNNIEPELISALENLQMLPWKENRTKWHNAV